MLSPPLHKLWDGNIGIGDLRVPLLLPFELDETVVLLLVQSGEDLEQRKVAVAREGR